MSVLIAIIAGAQGAVAVGSSDVLGGTVWTDENCIMLGMCIGLGLGMWAANVMCERYYVLRKKLERCIWLCWSSCALDKLVKRSARAFSFFSSLLARSVSSFCKNDNCCASKAFWKRSWRQTSHHCKKNPNMKAKIAPSATSETLDQSTAHPLSQCMNDDITRVMPNVRGERRG